MVDDQVAGNLRVDLRRVAAQVRAGLAHHGKVHEHRHAREVLEQHARRAELHLAAHLARATRLDHALSQIGSRLWVLGVTQHVFEQHLQRIGKLLGTLDLLNGIVGISRIAHGQGSGELLVLHIVPSWCVSHPDIDLAEHDSAGDLAHRRKPYRESVSTSSRTRRRNPFGYQAPTFSRARRRKPYWKSAPTSNCTRRLKPTRKSPATDSHTRRQKQTRQSPLAGCRACRMKPTCNRLQPAAAAPSSNPVWE